MQGEFYYGYGRVSTIKQAEQGVSLDMQEAKEKTWIAEQAPGAALVFKAESKSGKRGSLRPVYSEILQGALTNQDCKGIIVYSISRAGRSMRQLLADVEALEGKGKKLVLIKEGFADRSTAAGRMVWNILASFAEFEIEQMRERLYDGYQEYRKSKGKVGRRPVEIVNVELLVKDQKDNVPLTTIAKRAKVRRKDGTLKEGISVITMRNKFKEMGLL